MFGKRAETVWRYPALRAQRVLNEGEEIDKRRGNMRFPFLLPARAAQAQRIPPAAAGEIPRAPGSGRFHKEKRRPLRAKADIHRLSEKLRIFR